MRTIFTIITLLIAGSANAADHVNGYTRRDGTYVQPHYRSGNDGNPYNNYSTQGNYNPYTGNVGTVNPYAQPVPTPRYDQPSTYNSYPAYGR